MISEPELSGPDDEGAGHADLIGDRDGRPPAQPYPVPRLLRGLPAGRGHWTWALGGVVVASAVWAGSLYVSGVRRHETPDLHGYRLDLNPCAGSTLKPLADAIGGVGTEGTPTQSRRGPALDQIRCSLATESQAAQGWTTRYSAAVSVDLHKSTDPRAEFEDQRRLEDPSLNVAESIESVPGLGDQAYVLILSDTNEELKILHGGAVFTLTLGAYDTNAIGPGATSPGDAPPPPDLERFQPAMIAAARNVMAALRR